MKTKKSDIQKQNDMIKLPEGVNWAEAIKLIKEEENQQFLKKISPSILKFALEESNRSKVIEALVKALIKTDPQNATKEDAEKILEAMREVARIVLTNR